MPKRGANIYKRKDGRWEARYPRAIGPDGRKIYASVYASNYREAKNKQIQSMQQVHLSGRGNLSMTLEELMWCWLDSNANAIRRSTYLKYESLIRNHLTAGIGAVQAQFVTGQMIDRLADEKLHGTPPLSPKTVNDLLVILGSAFSYAQQEFGLPRPTIHYVKEPKRQMRVLSREEQKTLEAFLLQEPDPYKMGVLLALYTGLRVGELCAQEWEDVRDGDILVSKTLHRIRRGNGTVVEISAPKTESSHRRIPLPGFLARMLEQYRSSGSLLKTSAGKSVEPRLMQVKFSGYITACGLEKANFHALRHTFATRCVEAGFDPKTLSEILGHSDVKTTLNRYVHSSYELKQRSMEKLQMAATIESAVK